MNSPNPVTSPAHITTPIASQWDSSIIKLLATALASLGGLAAVVVKVFFPKLNSEVFEQNWGLITAAGVAFLVAIVALVQAWRARLNQPTPPIAGSPAVEKTIEREANIASASSASEMEKAVKMKVSAITVLLTAALVLPLLHGCAISPSKPIEVAQSIPQKGYAAAGLYSILQARALDVMKIRETPDGVKTAIADADAKATPVVLQLTQALKLYTTIEMITEGPAGSRLAEAVKRIDELTKQAAPLIDALRSAIGSTPAPAPGPTPATGALDLIPRGEPALAWSDAR